MLNNCIELLFKSCFWFLVLLRLRHETFNCSSFIYFNKKTLCENSFLHFLIFDSIRGKKVNEKLSLNKLPLVSLM